MSFNADVQRVLDLVSSNDIEKLRNEEFDAFQYQGFDPKKVAESLAKVKDEKKISDESFINDVLKMVAIAMIKGSVNDHNMKKMSEEGQGGIKELNGTYGIRMGGGKGLSASVLTYPRVMATFPDIAIRLTQVIGPKEFRGGPMMSTRLPPYMQVQVFPAIIPRDLHSSAKKMLLTAALCYSIDQTVQISRIENPDLKTIAATQSNFVSVGHGSPVPSEATRKLTLVRYSISSDYNQIVSVLNDYKAKVDDTFEILLEGEFTKMIRDALS